MVFVSISRYMCCRKMCVSAVFGNQLELGLGLLLIFQPIVMKHCCEGPIEQSSLGSGVVCCCLAEFLYSNWLKGFIVPECGV